MKSLLPVFLNHFYVVLDSRGRYVFTKAFCPNETRTAVRADATYTGLYFYGIHTYSEVFDVSNSPRRWLGTAQSRLESMIPVAYGQCRKQLAPNSRQAKCRPLGSIKEGRFHGFLS